MKIFKDEEGILYVGTAREICSLYKNFVERAIWMPSHCDWPKFNMDRNYGIHVYYKNEVMYVVSASTVLTLLFNIR